MGVLSKCSSGIPPAGSLSCYDVAHTWDPSCGSSALQMGCSVFRQSVKLYGVLYFATALLKARGQLDKEALKRAAVSAFRSSSFLSVNAAGFLAGFCLLGKLKGGLWAAEHAWLPGLIASLAAINMENPERQKLLSLYVINVATETLLRMSHARGWSFLPAVNSKKWTLVFSLVSAMAMYLHQQGMLKTGIMASALRYVCGESPWETMKKDAKMRPISSKTCGCSTRSCVNAIVDADTSRLLESNMGSIESYIKAPDAFWSGSNPPSWAAGHDCHVCSSGRGQHEEKAKPAVAAAVAGDNNNGLSNHAGLNQGLTRRSYAAHPHPAALSYSPLPKQWDDQGKETEAGRHGSDWAVVKYCLSGFVRPLALGLALSSGLRILGKPAQAARNPAKFMTNLLKNSETYRLGLFMGAFTGSYRAVRSCLTKFEQDSTQMDCNGNRSPPNHSTPPENSRLHGWKEAMAAFAAGSTMLLYPSSSVVIHAAWRCVHASLEQGMTRDDAVGDDGAGDAAEGRRKLTGMGAWKWLYAVACGVILQAAVLEPHNLKGSYWKFLNRATDGLIAQMNRSLMDPLGYASSTVNPSFRPNYNWKLISPALRELIHHSTVTKTGAALPAA